MLISESELIPFNHLDKRGEYEEEERSLAPVSHHGGLAIESIKWSDLDPHSKESKNRDSGQVEIQKNDMDFECESIVDNSFGLQSSYPAISLHQIGSVFMSKKSAGELGTESQGSLTPKYNVELPPQDDRMQSAKALLLDRDLIIKNSFKEWSASAM